MTQAGYIPPLLAPDIEDLGIYYFSPLLTPTVVDTRLPKLDNTRDVENGFVTIESVNVDRVDLASYELSFLMHAYHPTEAAAADLSRYIMAYGTAVQGLSVMGWYIMGLVNATGGRKLPNPDVDLPRYRSSLTWRVQGRPIGLGGGGTYVPPSNGNGDSAGVFIFGELLQGNGIDVVFTLANFYAAGTVVVYVNGIRQEATVDYAERGSGTIAFATPPDTDDAVIVDYQLAN
jgi:hypothetical protein